MKSDFLARTRLLSAVVFLAAVLLIGKLYFIQIVNGENYRQRAEHQYFNSNSKIFNRGSIFFETKNGTRVSAATLKTGFNISINPQKITDPEGAYKKLSKFLKLNEADFIEQVSHKNDSYEEIMRKVDEETSKKVESLEIPGLSLYRENWRFYPANKMASHVLGFVGYKGDELLGRYGLENYYEDTLKRTGDDVYENFFNEMFSNLKKVVDKNQSLEGDIVTAIEPNIQNQLEEEIAHVAKKWNSKLTSGLILNPKTGEIYAMATTPNFDPNSFQTEKNSAVFTNPVVESVYEMGSIIKPLTVAFGIDSGSITPETTYYDAGTIQIGKDTISNYDKKTRGIVNMQEILNQSLNTGVAFIVDKMGKQKFSEYMLSLGFGEETGIDLPNETAGLVSNLKKGSEFEIATASFGQGIAMTPISTARALAVLANGGILINPHIVKKIDYRMGFSKKVGDTPEEGKRIIKPETSEEITRMLVKVVDTALLGGSIKMDRYSIAAKTGTAQIAKSDKGGYYDDRFLHSFFGYFPAYDPKFLVFLYTIEPQGASFASHTLTEPFVNLAKFLLNYYDVPPDR